MTTPANSFDASTLPELPLDNLRSIFPADEAAHRAKSAGAKLESHRQYRRNVDNRRLLYLERIDRAVEIVGTLPAAGESIHLITAPADSVGTWHILEALLRLSDPAVCESLHVATLGINDVVTGALLQAIDAGRIRRCVLLASTYFRSLDASLWANVHNGLTTRGQKAAVARSHGKILAAELSDGRSICIESSANMRGCSASENVTICMDRELTRFHSAWIESLVDRALQESR